VSNLFEFPLPDIGEGVAEGEIVQWMVREGDAVQEDQELVEVMTDKATVPITSPVSGTVRKIVAQAGSVVPVGSVLVTIQPAEGAHVPTVHAHGGASHGEKKEMKPSVSEEPAPVEETEADAPAEPEFQRAQGERALATPYTRKLARELGVDLEKVQGSGEIGRVTPEDVRAIAERKQKPAKGKAAAAAAAPQRAPSLSEQVADTELPTIEFVPPGREEKKAPAAAPAQTPTPARAAAPAPATARAPGDRETRVPIRGLRKKIYERMHQAKTTAAHFTYVDELDATELVRLRGELKATAQELGVKLTYLPFLMKAVVSALRKFPTLNGTTDDAKMEFAVKHYFNFGIAVDTEDGLIVPVVKDVDRRSILDLAAEIERLSKDARDGKSKLDDLRDGTFTITNAGNIGGLFATPVINYPEAAILGVHAIKRKPWVVGEGADERVEVRDIMYLSVSIDHRVNDGAVGARWMNHVIALLADPKRLLLEI
jgi:pyruvate dehydrogenase E2 component (dihydrolipoamide acetyltransferase)